MTVLPITGEGQHKGLTILSLKYLTHVKYRNMLDAWMLVELFGLADLSKTYCIPHYVAPDYGLWINPIYN